MQTKHLFVVQSSAGPNRDLSKGSREQPYWDDHAAFINRLDDEGFILLGGPLVDEGGAILVVRATDEASVRETMKDDPWYARGVLNFESVKRWEIFVDNRT
jgi:hypothetical protein